MKIILTPAKALLAGLLLGPACTFLASVANGYAAVYLLGLIFNNAFLFTTYFMLTNYIIHTFFAFLGGYVAARIAKQYEYYFAVAVAIVGIAANFFVFWLVKDVSAFQTQRPLDNYISLFATVPFALGGAYLAKKNNDINTLTSTN